MSLGIISFNIEKKSDEKIRTAFSNFLKRNTEYRHQFLQSNFEHAFDGYSYMGQEDSLNQYHTDMLHSFVISDFHDAKEFPIEFHDFLSNDWTDLVETIRQCEKETLAGLSNPVLNDLYESDAIGYMMSCNYYPKPTQVNFRAENNTRLSSHKDISLFSTFPFGVSKGLSYHTGDRQVQLNDQDCIFQFPGYFLEFATDNTYPALDHQVDLPENQDSERYSFAIFSIPRPNSSFKIGDQEIESSTYYSKYLSLF